MINFNQLALAEQKNCITIRQDLHRIPEIGYQERETSSYISASLKDTGLDVQKGIATYGISALLQTGKPGPTLLIRAEMDALPIKEKTGLPFSSNCKGKMHACGHDAHMAMVISTAKILSKIKHRLKGNIKFVFQPAEEGPGGAKQMIKMGVLKNPKVDYSLACHVYPEIPEGTIGIKHGIISGAMDRFDVRIIGKGGHAAKPHLCVDALEVGAQVVSALQRIVSRQMDPLNPAVVTIGKLTAGTAFNIIAEEAEMSGTTRTLDTKIWYSWPDRIEKIISAVCQSMGAKYEFNFIQGYPPVNNDATMVEVLKRCAAKVVGKNGVILVEPTMGGDDMSFFMQKTKGCYFFLGIGRNGAHSLHHPAFDLNQSILCTGVEIYCRVAYDLLREKTT